MIHPLCQFLIQTMHHILILFQRNGYSARRKRNRVSQNHPGLFRLQIRFEPDESRLQVIPGRCNQLNHSEIRLHYLPYQHAYILKNTQPPLSKGDILMYAVIHEFTYKKIHRSRYHQAEYRNFHRKCTVKNNPHEKK